MFFVLSKVLGWLAYPSNWIALLCVLGVMLLLIGRRRGGLCLMLSGIGMLLLFGYSPLSNVLLLTLSERFPAWQFDGRDPDGIIILGGAIEPGVSEARHTIELNAAAERVVAMLQLARQFPKARIVFSGGSSNLLAPPIAGAPIAGRLLQDFDINHDRVLLEGKSRTTFENATAVRDLLTPKPGERWLLVTSAFHMPRSIGAFRAVGFNVEAYPVDWRTRGWRDAIKLFRKPSDGLARADVAVKEWVGLFGYWLSGRSSALLPAPRN